MQNINDISAPKTPLWKTILKWVICILLLTYAAAAVVFARVQRDNSVCSGIQLSIEGNTLPDSILHDGVFSQLARYGQKIEGTPLRDLDVQKIEDYLENFSNFENVECYLDPENRLHVNVTPIQPEARVFEQNGKSYYINHNGKRIKANAEFFVDVPVLIMGQNTKIDPAYALPVIRRVMADKELSSVIGAFKLDGRTDILLVPRLRGHVVNFGDTTRFQEKKSALLTAYRDILPSKGWETYDTISVKFRNQIVASRRDKALASHGPTEDSGEDYEESTLPDLTDDNFQNTTEQNVE